MARALWLICAMLDRLPALRALAALVRGLLISRVAHKSPKEIGLFMQMVCDTSSVVLDRECRVYSIRHPAIPEAQRKREVIRLEAYQEQMRAIRMRAS